MKSLARKAARTGARNRLRHGAMALTAAVIALPALARAQDVFNGAGGDNNWDTPTNWSGGVPNNSAEADISTNTSKTFDVNYNYNGAAVALAELVVDFTPSGTQANTLSYTSASNGPLDAGAELIGEFGGGILVESAGANIINGPGSGLIMGDSQGSTGWYTLSGNGTLTSNEPEEIGQAGGGVFNQTGGSSNTLLGTASTLSLGEQPGALGAYNLGGTATLSCAANENVGLSGNGNFNQTGGTNTFTNNNLGFEGLAVLSIGQNASGSGSYTLSNGLISGAYRVEVGTSGTGTFVQSGGENDPSQLYIGVNAGSNGNYTLTSGTINTTLEDAGVFGSGTMTQTGGTNTIGTVGGLYVPGKYVLKGTGALISAGELITGVFNQSGSSSNSVQIATLEIGEQGTLATYNLSSGTLTQTGGEGELISGGFPTGAGGFPTGPGSPATLTQTGGANSGTNLFLGLSGSGIYTLSAGSATFTGGAQVGNTTFDNQFTGTGALTISNTGTLTVSGSLGVVNSSGAVGVVNLETGGTLAVGGLNMGGVSSGLNWTGGTLELDPGVGLTLDPDAPSNTTGSAFGPSLSLGLTQTLIVDDPLTLGGTGAFTLVNGGGTVTVKGFLVVNGSSHYLDNGGQTTLFSLSISTGGTVNVNSGITLNYEIASADPVSFIKAYLTNGANASAGVDRWNGPDMPSALAAADPGKFAVGYVDGNTDAKALSLGDVQPNQLLIALTLAGDAYLEGSVGFDDLIIVAQHYGQTGWDWSGGNFNYDPSGSVGFADLIAVAKNYGQSSGLNDGLAAPGGVLSLAWQAQPTAVTPEPLLLSPIALFGFLARRRRSPRGMS